MVHHRFSQILLPLFIVILAFSVRLYRLDAQSIWWDEGHSIQMASAPITQISMLPGMDVHPPGFFAALHGWMSIAGRSKFALRFFSVMFSVLTVAWVMRFGWMLRWHCVGIWAGLLMAISPFFVAYAQEVRMYAMVTFFATGSVYYLWQITSRSEWEVSNKGAIGIDDFGKISRISSSLNPSRWGRSLESSPQREEIEGGEDFQTRLTYVFRIPYLIPYILFTTISLYTHYFTIFLLGFENLMWLAWFMRRPSKVTQIWLWFGSQLAILLLFAPQLQRTLQQVTTYTNPNLNPPTLGYFITHNWQAYTLGLTINSDEVVPYLWALGILLIFGIIINHQSPIVNRQLLWVFSWLFIPMALFFIVLQQQPSYEPRYLMLATPSLMLLFAVALTSRRWMQWLGLGVVGFFIIGLVSYFSDAAYAKDDADAVAEFLAAETTPSDIVLVDVPHPFHYYADQIPAPTDYLFVDVHTAADTLNQQALGQDRLFWVTWWGSDTDPRGVIPYLLEKQAGPPTGELQFRGYQVVWYTLSDEAFSLPTDLQPGDVNFDNKLRLDGLAISPTVSQGGAVWATLHFSQLDHLAVNYKISLRLRSPGGAIVAQTDKLILNDRHFQTSAWPIDDPALNQAINVYTLSPLNSAYGGPLTLEAVVYDAETLAAIAAYGVPTTNDDLISAQIGKIEVK